MPRVAYLGPEGTFAHQAVGLVRGIPGPIDAVPRRTVVSVVEAVEDGDCGFGLVPFESSVEGQVNLTVDVLVHDAERIQVCEEVVLAVTFGAYRRPGDEAAPTSVASHPVGLAQCRRYVHDLGVAARETSSTAEACRLVAESDEAGVVAIASPTAAARWGLVAMVDGVEDFPGAETRFVVVGTDAAPPTGADRTMFVLVPPHDRAGVLLRALEQLSGRGLNLSSIASRPLRVRLGEYCFLLVVDGHVADESVAGAFDALRDEGYSIKVLGAYPRWGSAP
ncbi:MAG: prephenate dehydratase [Acidimicrobiia bacterium]|nr:prephenate dehydratase [Acidimicrobiia bacterium]